MKEKSPSCLGSRRIYPTNEESVPNLSNGAQTESPSKLVAQSIFHLVFWPAFACCLISLFLIFFVTTEDTGNLLWAALHGREAIVTNCSEWKEMVSCNATDYTPLARKAGGERLLASYQLLFILFSALYFFSSLYMVYRERSSTKTLRTSGGMFALLYVVHIYHWLIEKPLFLISLHYIIASMALFIICFFGLNEFCPQEKKIMQNRAESQAGLTTLTVAGISIFFTVLLIGRLTERSSTMSPLLVILIANFVTGVSTRVIIRVLNRCDHFPISLTAWLIFVMDLLCYTTLRDYITALGEHRKIFFVSALLSFVQVLRASVVSYYRRWKVDKKSKLLLFDKIEREKQIIVIDFVTDIATDLLSIFISALRSLSCDPRLFSVALPYETTRISLELKTIGIQLILELIADVLIVMIIIHIFRGRSLPFNSLKNSNGSFFLSLTVCLTVCSQYSSIGWIGRWGCLSCDLLSQGYICPTDCTD